MSKAIDLTGKKFGKLTVIKRVENIISPNGTKFAAWECQCDCGNVVNVRGYSLRNGNSTSCGCSRKESLKKLSTHGHSDTRIYKIWSGMKKRCKNPKSSVYKHYGGRGIRVCSEWENDFNTFYNWSMKNGYEENLTIDRINVNGDYSPDNCRWITMKEQANNKNDNHYIIYMGMRKTISEWGDFLGENPKLISWRLNHGWSEERALLGA